MENPQHSLPALFKQLGLADDPTGICCGRGGWGDHCEVCILVERRSCPLGINRPKSRPNLRSLLCKVFLPIWLSVSLN